MAKFFDNKHLPRNARPVGYADCRAQGVLFCICKAARNAIDLDCSRYGTYTWSITGRIQTSRYRGNFDPFSEES